MAKQKGWKINEYGVFDENTGRRIAGKTEEGIYQLMGYRFIPPEKRLGKNEFQLAVSS
jgi:DNA polymerase (family 10)